MLLETIEQSVKIRFRTKLYKMDICYCGGLSMICQNCGFFLVPLAASPHYMNIDIEDYPLGNHFLVLGQHAIPSLTIDSQSPLFHTEGPFIFMFIEPVNCAFCNQKLGFFVRTGNVVGSEWLLKHLVLNMEKVELEYKRSMLMESTISQLHGELIRMEIKKRSNKELKMEIDNERSFQDSKKEMQREQSIERFILNHTSAVYPENEKKGNLASRILGCLSFYDRDTQRLERTGKVMITMCNDLKRAMISKYEAIQKNKNEMLRIKREGYSREEGHSKEINSLALKG